ncbi:potassium-transporting ATPase subunit KdpC [Sphingopyxis sp.]|uniref:potassium-transporting ATPase subunit KdpC n=1 Tax=Sphingopyxis sp. TaxID=1908224 RepID=UPI001DA6A433|nr:potassium-transporting ATPase subunit KdpC [Sphingopyxis sp.]MBW8297266.1 potassium-transporting ATPase subunit KdpC [Sphingopyxis sp.]
MFNDLKSAVRPALVLTLLFAALLGIAYPLALTGIGQTLFPAQANGSLIRDGDTVVGSDLIGQKFTGPTYFRGRPSAAGADGYDAAASGSSNLGPASRALTDRVNADITTLAETTPSSPVPPDLVTASASGLDPHISPEAAFSQVNRIAAARRLPAAQVRSLVAAAVEQPALGFLGEPQVNVLLLNRALDESVAQK